MTPTNLQLAVEAYRTHKSKQAAADSLGWTRSKMRRHLHRAAERGLLGPAETLPGYRIDSLTTTPAGTYVKQRKEHGEHYTPTLPVKGKTTLLDAEGRIITQHIMERATWTPSRRATTARLRGRIGNTSFGKSRRRRDGVDAR